MSAQTFRHGEAGRVDRGQTLNFTFNGQTYQGYAGDSLASALLANGVRLIGRSFKYHRPRGILSAGAEEPSGLVQLGSGNLTEPNIRTTETPLVDGQVAASQHCWPSVKWDMSSINSVFGRFLPAGFYYKTFMGPTRRSWLFYEHFIRKAAGLGEGGREKDPSVYDHHFGHCDVLVVGGGPAGIAAALAAGRSGARVILAERDWAWGGSLLSEAGEGPEIDGKPAMTWLADALAELESLPDVTLMLRCNAFGYYDQNMVGLHQINDPPGDHQPRGRFWKVRAGQVVMAAGSIERPLVFTNNDRPGHLLAGAARTYLNRFGVLPGKAAVVFTNNDSAYQAAFELADAGCKVVAMVDPRGEIRADLAEGCASRGIEAVTGHAVVDTHGGRDGIWGVSVMSIAADGQSVSGGKRPLNCDCLLSSGGWSPTVHLFSHAQGKLRYEAERGIFLPLHSPQAITPAGAANGAYNLVACLEEGAAAGALAAIKTGFEAAAEGPRAKAEPEAAPLCPLWAVPQPEGEHGKQWVDHQDDVTSADVALAARENFISVEHLKRYTTLGMGTDQGKTSNINGLGIMADILGRSPGEVGTTTFRPPYTPVTMGAVVGREVGMHVSPVRRTAMHDWHIENGAVMTEAGQWYRPRYYPRDGEDLLTASLRETAHVRNKVGICDVSTLGTIDIQGKDAAEFLNRVYINGFGKMPVGKARYGLMLRDDGIVYDDGTTSRWSDHHYIMTCTTANAARVMADLEYALQVLWPDLQVSVSSTTDLFAGVSIAGPNSREMLASFDSSFDFSAEGTPFMGVADGEMFGLPVKLLRISFSGELAYEVHCQADYGLELWEKILAAGKDFGLQPYGTEALGILRIEKGHVVIGSEIDGRTTADDLGMGAMLSTKKAFIGQRSLTMEGIASAERQQLVGLKAVDGKSKIRGGSQLVVDKDEPYPMTMEGHVASNTWSPVFDEYITLGLLERGRARIGEEIWALDPLRGTEPLRVKVVSSHFYDPAGEKQKG